MQIKLSYVGYLKFDGVANGSLIEVADGARIADVLDQLDVPKQQQRFLTTFVNDREERSSCALKEGDELTIIIQVGGGAPSGAVS